MTDSQPLPVALSRSRREETIQLLCARFADDELSVDEFERRVDLAHRVTSESDLALLVADLKPAPPKPNPVPTTHTAPVPAPAPTPLPAAHARESQMMMAVMAGVERKGRWAPARRNTIFAVMGGGELDFRDAILPAGVTEISIYAVMGGVEIIVPPGMIVDAGGIAIMGGFTHRDDSTMADPSAPILKIDGFVMMGGVDISVRRPGETAKDASRRIKQERKALRDRS